jgi:hypothetical protein
VGPSRGSKGKKEERAKEPEAWTHDCTSMVRGRGSIEARQSVKRRLRQ